MSTIHRRLSTFACLVAALGVAAGAQAQSEGTGSSGTWRPSGGSLFGNTPRPQQQTSGDDLTERPERTEEADDPRAELLVIDLAYEDGITFRDEYLERFDTTLWEQLDASPALRALTPGERQRRLMQATQILVDPITPERAEEVAEAIDAPYYLVPRVDIGDRSHYLISVTVGQAGQGEAGRHRFEATTGRGIDAVAEAIEDLTSQALAAAGE